LTAHLRRPLHAELTFRRTHPETLPVALGGSRAEPFPATTADRPVPREGGGDRRQPRVELDDLAGVPFYRHHANLTTSSICNSSPLVYRSCRFRRPSFVA